MLIAKAEGRQRQRMDEPSSSRAGSNDISRDSSPASAGRDIRVFLCYRRSDGAWHAEWLNERLSGAEYTDSAGNASRVRLYYDKTAPGVADWKSLHFPSLQASQALIVVCTPGIAKDFSKRGRSDWVYEELRWWIRHRRTAPIVIDATGEGDRWLPEMVGRKWPNINRIDLDKAHAEAAVSTGNVSFADRIRERVIGAIRESERSTIFEDLERSKRLTRQLAWALSGVLVLLLVAVFAGVQAYQFSRRAEAQRQSAVARLAITQAEIIRNEEPDAIELSVLLALEAYARSKSAEAERSLLTGLGLLPRHLARMEHSKDGLIARVVFSPDGKHLASSGRDYTARLWRVPTGEQLVVSKNNDVVLGLAFSRDGQYLATGSGDVYCSTELAGELSPKDRTARVLRVPTGEVVTAFTQESSVLSVAFSPDGKLLVTGGCDRTARLWDIHGRKEVARMRHDDEVSDVAFSNDGRYVATASWDRFARFWAVPSGREVTRMPHDEAVETVVFSPNGKYLAAGTVGNTAYLWDASSGKSVTRMVHADRAHSVTFSPDGQFLATVSYDHTVLIWEVPQGRVAARFVLNESGYEAVFSPDTRYLAIGSHHRLGRVWDWSANREAARIVNTDGIVGHVAFSPDGRYLATGGLEGDHSVRLWELPYKTTVNQDLQAEACSRLRRNFSRDEWRKMFGPEPYRNTCPGLPEGKEGRADALNGEKGE